VIRIDNHWAVVVVIFTACMLGLGILIGIGTAAAQDQPSWPQVCRAVQPEDLDR
jgi:hypothetical protein